ncbi:hypothetical protein Pan216_47510 [Planctomycetes bacterium Pan216]|uniref:Cytochrome c oxidase polypeptide IV n=1 Tax=Kolteria novifilia TaxID=2527975 RepID=A0A518BA57_9BACT|nr:hypothetical protein Pan216_47510 [Planctomycetes bacterium Pan216]
MSTPHHASDTPLDGHVPAPDDGHSIETVELPGPTAWPLVLSVGLIMVAFGILTNISFSFLGIIMALVGIVGWVTEILPGRGHIHEELRPEELRPKPVKRADVDVIPMAPGMPGHRMHMPEKVHPYSAGAKAGLVGGVAMAVLAAIYGVVSGRGIWYPVNLLAGMVLEEADTDPVAQLEQFHLLALILGLFIHAVGSLFVGLIYGIVLPMIPRGRVLFGGLVAPLFWSGCLWASMDVLDPVLAQRVDWVWFIASQFAYGIVVGIIVVRTEKIHTTRGWRA